MASVQPEKSKRAEPACMDAEPAGISKEEHGLPLDSIIKRKKTNIGRP